MVFGRYIELVNLLLRVSDKGEFTNIKQMLNLFHDETHHKCRSSPAVEWIEGGTLPSGTVKTTWLVVYLPL